SSRITSFRNLRNDNSSSNDEEGQRFYAGGSEHSGQEIVGPPKSPNKIVEDLFKKAKEHGAVPVDHFTRRAEDSGGATPFSGGGYRLGASSLGQSEYISGENSQDLLQDVQILLKLWSNGFSLDDGELRPYTDPDNAQFLESIKRGEIPVEFQRLVHGGQVNLDMEDHRDQEYVRPKLKFKAFSGEGQKLGSLTPQIISTPPSPEDEEKEIPFAALTVNESEPTTNLQIRLADGSRLVQQFNQTHRISDVRQLILQSQHNSPGANFVLMTTFPSRELTDENQTLQQANLLNAVIVQRIK
uniref:UBX domain-containing protein 2B n=2 Tax=Latimeria chalumnae TaxID=7897 RepID=H3AIT2_LATCH